MKRINTRTPLLPTPTDKSILKRTDRSANQFRKVFLKNGIVTQASGSAYIEMNKTKVNQAAVSCSWWDFKTRSYFLKKVICAVYGPRHSSKAEFSDEAKITCDFKFATFSSVDQRKKAGSLGSHVSKTIIISSDVRSQSLVSSFDHLIVHPLTHRNTHKGEGRERIRQSDRAIVGSLCVTKEIPKVRSVQQSINQSCTHHSPTLRL